VRGERLNDGLSALAVGHGPPLVVLPGWGQGTDLSDGVPRATAWSNAAVAARLGRTIHLIHRPLDPPPGMTFARLAGWHATAFRARFAEPVDVMGISAGGVTALQLALDYPGTVRRLVICVAASRVGDRGRRDLRRLVELEAERRSGAALGSSLVAHGALRLVLLAGYSLSRGRPRAPGETALVEAAQTWDVTGRLAEIKIPVLLLGGARDHVIPPELVRATASGLPDARLVLLPGRGHLSALYDRRLKPAIAAFLAEPAGE
jgi:pimeloyl-ACP methyl ester carboxylesterase